MTSETVWFFGEWERVATPAQQRRRLEDWWELLASIAAPDTHKRG